MSESNNLIPVFVPPLAMILGVAERKKGEPLTEAEVNAIRDESACIMMPPAEAEKMAETRGFADINPNNCWADWHRLRPQMIGHYLPRIILCIPGDEQFRERCEPILTVEQVEHDFRPRDPGMIKAFRASSMVWPTFTPDDFARIERHSTVLYVLSENYIPAVVEGNGLRFLMLGKKLLDAGGIKSDSSGISHSRDRWSKFVQQIDQSHADKWSALFHAYVVYPIRSSADLYTCGMHLLGAPDLIVSASAINVATGQDATAAAVNLFRIFAMYLLSECPAGKFASGHTFSVAKDAPRYRVKWEPCTGFAEDSFFFNPFGRWRFEMA